MLQICNRHYIESISYGNEEMLLNVISFIDKRDEAWVFSSKEEIVRRATCKFVRNFHPPPALVPSRREKRDTGTGRGGKRSRPSKKTKSQRRKRNKKEGGRRRVFSVPGSWRFMRPKSCAPAGNETSRGKRVEGR